ncbi:MAG TPA: sugar phosphate nucleotidyltransferase [Gemmatimonadaceae bacterium]|nr:sugar phosphate nucleotidyltransferase [Gemmatimonadaceae bacterium]
MRKNDSSASLESDQSAVADAGVKAMIPVGRPFLDFVLSALADAGFSRVCLIVGPEHGIIRDHYEGEGRPTRVAVEFAIQEKPLGTANALLSAEHVVGGNDFIVLNSDNYYPPDSLRRLRLAPTPAIAGFRRRTLVEQGNVAPDRVARFGALDVDDEGFLRRIMVGKDAQDIQDSDNALASMNCWSFDHRIFDACRLVPISVRNEFELPQAVQLAIDTMDMRIRVIPIDAGVLDLSSRSDIAAVTRRLSGITVSL